jgi:hypothetical protein
MVKILSRFSLQDNLALSSQERPEHSHTLGNGPNSCRIPAGMVMVPLHVEYPPEHFLALSLEGLAPIFSVLSTL